MPAKKRVRDVEQMTEVSGHMFMSLFHRNKKDMFGNPMDEEEREEEKEEKEEKEEEECPPGVWLTPNCWLCAVPDDEEDQAKAQRKKQPMKSSKKRRKGKSRKKSGKHENASIGVEIKHPYEFLRSVDGDLEPCDSTYKVKDTAVGWSPFVKDLVNKVVADARAAFAQKRAEMGWDDDDIEISVYVGSSQDVQCAINRNARHLCRSSDINGKRRLEQAFVRIISDPSFTRKTEDEASLCVESLESMPASKVFSNNVNAATAHSGPTLYFCVTTGTPTERGQRSAEYDLRITGMDAYSAGTSKFDLGTSETQLKTSAHIASIVTKLKQTDLAEDVMFAGGAARFKNCIIQNLGRLFWTSNVAPNELDTKKYRKIKNAYNSSG